MAGTGLAEWGSGGATKGYAQIFLGHSGLLLLTQDHHEAYFKVIRMRCWRITTLRPVIIDSLPKYNYIMYILCVYKMS